MAKKWIFICALGYAITTNAQDCNCRLNFEWVKKTFEENDAGFRHAVESKGQQTYADHTARIQEKVEKAANLQECGPILYEWLRFFRSGHIAIRLNQQVQQPPPTEIVSSYDDWETFAMDSEYFHKYLDNLDKIGYEGIWQVSPYTIGIKKEGEEYIGFIIESGAETWTKGQVKLKFDIRNDTVHAVYYMRDHSPLKTNRVFMTGKNHLQIGDFMLARRYPVLEDEPVYQQYFRSIQASDPYLEVLNETTLYLRIPSFDHAFKPDIDSVLTIHKNRILSTKNLIIDIRNNGGGSDVAYSELIPFLYTNPIRGIGVEFLSTELNNQRMLDFIHKPEYGFDEEGKKWAEEAYQKLAKKLGQFVNLNETIVEEDVRDTVYSFPEKVGIIINGANGSTAEQFLLEAKQSQKVKLFGVTTYGSLDISNMYFVDSPCKEFQLGYCLSRSLRIPDFTIDEKGLQPDYYLDKSIPAHEWTEYVNKVLNTW